MARLNDLCSFCTVFAVMLPIVGKYMRVSYSIKFGQYCLMLLEYGLLPKNAVEGCIGIADNPCLDKKLSFAVVYLTQGSDF